MNGLTFALAFALCSFSSITPPAASGCATSFGCCFATAAEDDISADFVVFLDNLEIGSYPQSVLIPVSLFSSHLSCQSCVSQ